MQLTKRSEFDEMEDNTQGQVNVSPSTLVFTPTNWNVPRTVVVSATDDSIVDDTGMFHIEGKKERKKAYEEVKY